MSKNPMDEMRNEVVNSPTTLDIVSSLMDDKNIVMKTEITNPYALDTLMTIAEYLKKHGEVAGHDLIVYWVNLLLKYMVSNKRKGRQEITEILKGYFTAEREKEKQLSLTSNLAKANNNQNSF